MSDRVRPLLFCHIPKTAGTAFRVALERVVPPERVLRDYGSNTRFTTPELGGRLAERPANWDLLCGHFPISKYGALFPPHRIVTFLRRPLQQLVSHFEHYRRQNGYIGTLREFADASHGAGMQSRMLGGVPVQLLGLVGVTESVSESATALQRNLGWQLEIPRWNENPEKTSERYAVDIEDFSPAAQARLQQDFWVYVQAQRTLHERIRFQQGEWTHGAITQLDPQRCAGIAFRPGAAGRFIPLRILVNGREVAFTCTGYPVEYPCVFDWEAFPRSAFELMLKSPLNGGDIIDLFAADTDQRMDSVIWHGTRSQRPWMPAPLKHWPV